MERTKDEMEHRLAYLRGLLNTHTLSLRLSAELDAIQNYGLAGWTEFLKKKSRKRR